MRDSLFIYNVLIDFWQNQLVTYLEYLKANDRMEKSYWYIGKEMGPDDQIFHFYVYISWVSFTQQLLWGRVDLPGYFMIYEKEKKEKKLHLAMKG